MTSRMLRARAFAKINVTLRVLGMRPDGYHELRTVFQSLSLHDTLVVERRAGPFRIICSDPACPDDRTNLVWRAADALWRHGRRRGTIAGAQVRLTKRIPIEAGLGGGSSDAAAALRVLSIAWGLKLPPLAVREVAASLGADVPFFLTGGTALGIERGDVLLPLADLPSMWVVVVVPPFGVSTRQAYARWDRQAHRSPPARPERRSSEPVLADIPASELRNDLEPPVAARHPEIGRIIRALSRSGADHAAMSGSGSAVFGLFRSRPDAAAAAVRCAARGRRVILTRTLGRSEYGIRANSR